MLNGVSLLVNSYFKGRIRRGFYIALWPAPKNGSTRIIPSAENHGKCPDMPSRLRPDQTFMVQRLCSTFGGTSSVWCIMSCWNRVKPSQGISIERNWCIRAEHWRRNGHNTKRDTTRLSSSMTILGRMSLDRTYLKTLKWEVLPHSSYSPDVALSDYHLFRPMVHGLDHQHFRSHKEVKKWIDLWITSENASFFRDGIWQLPEIWIKVVTNDEQ